jgi:hypothetical protein
MTPAKLVPAIHSIAIISLIPRAISNGADFSAGLVFQKKLTKAHAVPKWPGKWWQDGCPRIEISPADEAARPGRDAPFMQQPWTWPGDPVHRTIRP